METQEVNKLINQAIEKYDLEGHENVFGGMVWFALCLQDKEAKCIDDHYKNGTYNFATPRFDNNADDIYEVIQKHTAIIDEKLKERSGALA